MASAPPTDAQPAVRVERKDIKFGEADSTVCLCDPDLVFSRLNYPKAWIEIMSWEVRRYGFPPKAVEDLKPHVLYGILCALRLCQVAPPSQHDDIMDLWEDFLDEHDADASALLAKMIVGNVYAPESWWRLEAIPRWHCCGPTSNIPCHGVGYAFTS